MNDPLASSIAGPMAGSGASAVGPASGSGPAAATPAAMKRVAEEFEAVFLAQFLGSLTAGIGTDGLTADSSGGGQEIFRDMMNQEMASLISRTGGIGVADMVLQEMLKMQEVA